MAFTELGVLISLILALVTIALHTKWGEKNMPKMLTENTEKIMFLTLIWVAFASVWTLGNIDALSFGGYTIFG